MASPGSHRRLLLLLLVCTACLTSAAPPASTATQGTWVETESRNGDGKDCGFSEADDCGELARCSPPSLRLAVPEAAVLVLGNTGSGKSALSRHLAGDDGDMRAVVEGNEILIAGNKIGSSITSITKVPELMTDNRTGTNYFDCPGFEDTRGPCVEVATTFYMKDILRRARRVKVLLLTPYFAVRRGQDRGDFLSMLMHAARVLRDVGKMRDSVALVVTKVEAFARRGQRGPAVLEPLPEHLVKQGVAAFLVEDVMPFLVRRVNEGGNASVEAGDYQRAIQLLDVFLEQDAQANFTNIGIFRAPDQEGLLVDSPLMEQGRHRLRDLVEENLRYAEVRPGDFGFSVSDRTKLFAMRRSRALRDAVAFLLAEAGSAAVAARVITYERIDNHDEDVAASARGLARDADEVRAVAADVANSSGSVQTLCDRLAAAVRRAAGLEPDHPLSESVANECRYLDVLRVVGDAEPAAEAADAADLALQWSRPLREAADELAGRADWNRFLVSLYDRLNMLDQQMQLAEGRLQLPPSAATNLTAVEEWASSLGLHAKLRDDAADMYALNALLARMAAGLRYECLLDGNLLVVRGESVLLSEVAARLLGGSPCGHRPQAVSRVEVYALNTVFVDASLRLPGASLAIVAPRWEVIGLGDRTSIDLSGQPGDEPASAPEAVVCGERGADGRAGRPGRPGGHFLGVGLDFAGGQLRVDVSGGRGGDGQRGGDGGPGSKGGSGGRGGDGGVGGLGGKPGSAVVLGLVSPRPLQSAVILADKGRDGAAGRGGRGGELPRELTSGTSRRKRAVVGGLEVLAILAVGGLLYASLHPATTTTTTTTAMPPLLVVISDGAPGVDGGSIRDSRLPEDPRLPPWIDVPSRTAAYLELNRRHPYRREQLSQFKKLLEKSYDFQRLGRIQ